jgi:hypothetical protein
MHTQALTIHWRFVLQAAQSVSELYSAAAEAYAKPALVKHLQREWAEANRVKALMYAAEAHFLQVCCQTLCCAENALVDANIA